FARALAIDPRALAALVGAGTALYRERSFTEALARFQAAQSADPRDVDARVGVAMASLELDRPADARAALEPLLHDARTATEARVHFWYGRALAAAGEYAGAERALRETVRLDDTHLEAYTRLAALLQSQQRADAAEAVLREARAHVSDQAAIHRALGES